MHNTHLLDQKQLVVTNFDLDKTEISGNVGDNVVVNASNIVPENAGDKNIAIGVEDKTIASVVQDVNKYTFSLLKAGTTKAHWVANGGIAKKDLVITVDEPAGQ